MQVILDACGDCAEARCHDKKSKRWPPNQPCADCIVELSFEDFLAREILPVVCYFESVHNVDLYQFCTQLSF